MTVALSDSILPKECWMVFRLDALSDDLLLGDFHDRLKKLEIRARKRASDCKTMELGHEETVWMTCYFLL
jgi:hypothetical protein